MLTGEGDKLYGAVTSHDIQEALKTRGILVEKKDIHLQEPIRKIGEHSVTVKLHPEVQASLKIVIVKKSA